MLFYSPRVLRSTVISLPADVTWRVRNGVLRASFVPAKVSKPAVQQVGHFVVTAVVGYRSMMRNVCNSLLDNWHFSIFA